GTLVDGPEPPIQIAKNPLYPNVGIYIGVLEVIGSAPGVVPTVPVHAEVTLSSLHTVTIPADTDHLFLMNLSAFSTDLNASPETLVQSRLSRASAFWTAVGTAAVT
ncbi:hypothetical protein, partial [Staphylococcus aureus]